MSELTRASEIVLDDLKLKYDALVEREKEHRQNLNYMRREVTQISRARKAAYRAWQEECIRLSRVTT